MQAHYRYKKVELCKYQEFIVLQYKPDSRLAVAVEGIHGEECVYCAAEIGGKLTGFPERAPYYKVNQWEHLDRGSDKNNTFFLPLSNGLEDKDLCNIHWRTRSRRNLQCLHLREALGHKDLWSTSCFRRRLMKNYV